MTKLFQIVSVLLLLQCLQTQGTPIFQGISFKQDFDISLKPFQFKPFSIFKEKWSPFGVFGKKHGIQKRDVPGPTVVQQPMNGALPTIEEELPLRVPVPLQSSPVSIVPSVQRKVPVRAPPVFEQTEPMPVAPLYVTPSTKPVIGPQSFPEGLPNIDQPIATQQGFVTNQPLAVHKSIPASPLPKVPLIMPPELARIDPTISSLKKEMEIPPISTVSSGPVVQSPAISPTPIQTVAPNVVGPIVQSVPPASTPRLLTNILYRDPAENSIQPFGPGLDKVVPLETNSITEKPKAQEENTFVRASRLALNFSQMFMQLMNQFFTNARATIDQYSNPPPVFRS